MNEDNVKETAPVREPETAKGLPTYSYLPDAKRPIHDRDLGLHWRRDALSFRVAHRRREWVLFEPAGDLEQATEPSN